MELDLGAMTAKEVLAALRKVRDEDLKTNVALGLKLGRGSGHVERILDHAPEKFHPHWHAACGTGRNGAIREKRRKGENGMISSAKPGENGPRIPSLRS